MYDLFKSLAAQLIMPLPIFAFVMVAGLVLSAVGRFQNGRGMIATAMVFLLLLSWAPLADRLLLPLEKKYTAMLELPESNDIRAIVVLGGGWHSEDSWSVISKQDDGSAVRLMEGVRLWSQDPELPLIVAAKVFAQAAEVLSVPASALRVLDKPADTGHEAKAVRELIGDARSIVLVTSASHMTRAMQHFQAAGLKPIPAPTHFLAGRKSMRSLAFWVPSAKNLHKSERAFYEFMGLLAMSWES